MKKLLDEVRTKLTILAVVTRATLKGEVPEVSDWGPIPDRDFKMRFRQWKGFSAKGLSVEVVAEYVDGSGR